MIANTVGIPALDREAGNNATSGEILQPDYLLVVYYNGLILQPPVCEYCAIG